MRLVELRRIFFLKLVFGMLVVKVGNKLVESSESTISVGGWNGKEECVEERKCIEG